MIRIPLERAIPVDLINQAQIAVTSASEGKRQDLEKFLNNLNPDDLALLEKPLKERFDAGSFGIDPDTWSVAKNLTPLAILRGIAEKNKFNKDKTSE